MGHKLALIERVADHQENRSQVPVLAITGPLLILVQPLGNSPKRPAFQCDFPKDLFDDRGFHQVRGIVSVFFRFGGRLAVLVYDAVPKCRNSGGDAIVFGLEKVSLGHALLSLLHPFLGNGPHDGALNSGVILLPKNNLQSILSHLVQEKALMPVSIARQPIQVFHDDSIGPAVGALVLVP